MVSFDFIPNSSSLTQCLSAMLGGLDVEATDKERVKTEAQAEAKALIGKADLVDRIATAIFEECGKDIGVFLGRTGEAYYYLGVSDDVRAFVGQIWSQLLKTWPQERRLTFLNQIHVKNGHDLFSALDFLPIVVRDIEFPARFLYEWLAETNRRTGTDFYQRGFSLCLKNIAAHHIDHALAMVELWIDARGPAAQRGFIAFLLAQIRRGDSSLSASQQARLNAIQQVAKTRGSSSLRVMELDSWASYATSPRLDEMFALGLREMVEVGGADELRSWSRLLNHLAAVAPEKIDWVYRELLVIAETEDQAAREWIATAAVDAWMSADESSRIKKQDWECILRLVHPIKKEEAGIWRKFEHSLVDAVAKDDALTLALLEQIALGSGSQFAKRLESKRGGFVWFCRELERSPHASVIVSRLCFHAARKVRRIGLRLQSDMDAVMLDSHEVASATASQLELLLLELTFLPLNYETSARVHAGIVDRVLAIGGNLENTFVEQVKMDALNTNKYRTLLAEKCAGNSRVAQLLEDVMATIKANAEAGKSPALQMEVPGFRRAAELSMRHFSRTVAAGAKEFSVLAQFATTIPLLYGKKWRIHHPNGQIGEASGLHQTGVSMEMPRMDFMCPEGMRLQRMAALARIKELDAAGAPEDE